MAQELKAETIVPQGSTVTLQMYPKAEVDAVLAEKDKEIAELKAKLDLYKRGWAENDKVNAYLYAENRHHKYKRCFKMAQFCKSMMVFNSKYGTAKKWHLFKKWRDRWLELAEKFKEAK